MPQPVIHLDANYFYAQVEALFRPELRGKAFAVGGHQDSTSGNSKRGIVLTKSPLAKKIGIKTGISIRDALDVYPKLIVIPANYPLYLFFSQRMREIVLQHTDIIKPFGSDEMWAQLYGNRVEARKIIDNIRLAIWRQLCLTVSIGVAENLPYAKIGSDLAGENEVCELWTEDREKRVYPLPVSDLLYVGPSTTEKFNKRGIKTIGDLAKSSPEQVCRILKNKTGESLWVMANGQDTTPVACLEGDSDEKSIGQSNTMMHDLTNDDAVKAAFYMLCEPVSQRMRENGFEARTVNISVRDNDLISFERQIKLDRSTNLVAELVPAAMQLFKKNYRWYKPVRSLGIRGSDLIAEGGAFQLNLFEDEVQRNRTDRLERCIDRVRGRYGHFSIQRAVLMHEHLKSVNANNDIGDAQTFYSYR